MRNHTYIWPEGRLRKRNHLPHIDIPGGLYFVTWCLADAVPPGFLNRLQRNRAARIAQIRRRFGDISTSDLRIVDKQMRMELFSEMDRGRGRCELAVPEVARMVQEALRYFDRDRYRLFNYSVMPNHVHVIFQPKQEWPWWKIVGNWKSFTAKEANRILRRSGTLWQDDNWDVIIRSAEHFERARRYVLANPAKAGLESWPWVEDLISCGSGE